MYQRKYYYQKDPTIPFLFIGTIDCKLLSNLANYILTNSQQENIRKDGNKFFEGSLWWPFPFSFRYPEYSELLKKLNHKISIMDVLCQPIFKRVEELCPTFDIFTAELNGINPNGFIKPHIDHVGDLDNKHWWLGVTRRIHVPIITNHKSIMYSNKASIHFPIGTIYEFNNTVMHHVENLGDTIRAHLVLDLIPKAYRLDIDHFMKIDKFTPERHITNFDKFD
jgi:hypothetical protein